MKPADRPYGDTHSSHLCDTCATMNFWSSGFRIEDTWTALEVSQRSCDFCKMRWDVAKALNRATYPSISFERSGSMLKMNDDKKAVFSICRSPGKLQIYNCSNQLMLTTAKSFRPHCQSKSGCHVFLQQRATRTSEH